MDRAIELCEHLTHVLDECTSRPLDQPHPRTFVLESLGKWINSDRDVLSHYLGRMNTGSASPEPREDPKKGTHMEKKTNQKDLPLAINDKNCAGRLLRVATFIPLGK
ncbi:hypothetical protein POX_e07012 [Penicillium oxalicum]|uniref:hypothetical protein n=1 Tax=Penicillium oxalicum TaxID=69781 RepID=UPI0020B6B73E|nr:hypothetical protein POX_e07012 [Penicillium oxalicum]KAI2788986.1 hypothetical protein POX_e07012 [Penicillium oxalicum]